MEQKKKFLVNAAYWSAVAVLAFLALKYALPFLLPFFIGFLIAFCVQRPARFMARRLKSGRRPWAGVLLTALLMLLFGAAGYVVFRLVLLARTGLEKLPAFYAETCRPVLEAAGEGLGRWLDPETGETVVGLFSQWTEKLTAGFFDRVGSAVVSLPTVLVPVLFSCISAVFFTMDYDRVVGFLAARLPLATVKKLHRLKSRGIHVAGRMARAYFLLFCLTFGELFVGFLVLRVPMPAGVAILIAVVDIFPVLGTGTVMVPWILISFLSGENRFALGLLILYAIIWTVRQLCEPKLVGRQLGLHPLASLLFLYVGLRLFGLIGMLILPWGATLYLQLRAAEKEIKKDGNAAEPAAPEVSDQK